MREATIPDRTPFGRATRDLFGFDHDWTPLNHGSYGTAPLAVNSERSRYLRASEARPDSFKLAVYPAVLRESRQAVAPLLGVNADEVVFVPNATTGLNTILRNLEWERGDVMLHFTTIYNACLDTLHSLQETVGLVPEEVAIEHPIEDEDVVQVFKQRAAEIQGQGRRVRAAMFDTITSTPGMVVPWEALTAVCRELGIASVVDGAHGIGHIDLTHLGKVKPDYFVSNCHKWLFAPRGCAVLYVPFHNQHHIKTTYPTSHGYEAPAVRSDINTTAYFQNLFVDVATLDNTTYCVVPHAIRFRQRACGGEAAIREYCQDLAIEGGRRAARILGTEVLSNRSRSAIQCCLTNVRLPIKFIADGEGAVDGAITVKDAEKVKTWLIRKMFDEMNAYIPPFFYGGAMWVRFSAQVYLTVEDIEWGARQALELSKRVQKGEWKES